MVDISWQGKLTVEGETAWWLGSIGDTSFHRHFAAQAIFSDNPVGVIAADGQTVFGNCVLIEPNALHRLLPSDTAQICYVEPTAKFGNPDLREKIDLEQAKILAGPDIPAFWQDWLLRGARPVGDIRVASVIDRIGVLLPQGTIRLADVAMSSGISSGRLRHLFSSEIGLPFQRYVLWRRLASAFGCLMSGNNVTQSAHEAGFADAAHFARTVKSMFGIRATDIFPQR